ncbi:MAG TPA: NAD(+) synthase [Haloplasmataceae bacterium]
MHNNYFIKVAAIAPTLEIGNPLKNVKYMLKEIENVKKQDPHFILFPELTITGYSCGDLFFQSYLHKENKDAINYFLEHNTFKGIIIFGSIYLYNNDLYNCAYVIKGDKVLGIVPKTYLPNRDEFYESRHFASGVVLQNDIIDVIDFNTKFGNQLFYEESKDVKFGVEICEDMWAPIPPSSFLVMSGAEIIFNVSSSNEILNKDEVRRYVLKGFTKRHNCAYVYCSSNLYESSQDTTFSNHCLILENGRIVNESSLFNKETTTIIGDIDLGLIKYLQCKNTTIRESLRLYKNRAYTTTINCQFRDENFVLCKSLSKTPFVPQTDEEKAFRKILNIQVAALARRIIHLNPTKVLLGLSGGLDSTLALLVLKQTFTFLDKDKNGIHLLIMPGPGTSDRTLNNAFNLAKELNLTYEIIDITNLTEKYLDLLKHDPNSKDITYENTQARIRTSLLFNKANQLNGFVLGTGDMSELALGWCTYNGDQMSNYSINSGLPKTLVKFMVRCFALYEYKDNQNIYSTLMDILDTPISPELSSKNQKTEDIIGKYEVNDFILYRFLVCGDDENRIAYLLEKTFLELNKEDIENYLRNFFKRFFSQQFKRSALPDGPKVIDISLSPRTDFRMVSDIYYNHEKN